MVTCAAVRFFAVDAGLPLRQVAEQVVGLLRGAEPSVRAWTEQPGDGITVHLSAVLNGTPVRGRMLLQARDGSVLATGLQAPASELAAQAQSDYVNAVRHLGQVRREAAASLADGAKRRMDAFLHEQELHVMPTLRGDQIMVNPVDGRRYEVPLSYGTYWSDAAQRVYRTSDPNMPPDVGASRLEPI